MKMMLFKDQKKTTRALIRYFRGQLTEKHSGCLATEFLEIPCLTCFQRLNFLHTIILEKVATFCLHQIFGKNDETETQEASKKDEEGNVEKECRQTHFLDNSCHYHCKSQITT